MCVQKHTDRYVRVFFWQQMLEHHTGWVLLMVALPVGIATNILGKEWNEQTIKSCVENGSSIPEAKLPPGDGLQVSRDEDKKKLMDLFADEAKHWCGSYLLLQGKGRSHW